jgi:ABC-2 type transport system ATP-binding protein
LDPLARRELSSIIRRLGEEGRAVLVSSHILSELREFCNAVGIMDQGHMKVSGLLKDILEEISPDKLIQIQMLHDSSGFGDFLNAKENISDLTLDGEIYSLSFQGSDEELAKLLKSIVDGGYPIIDFHQRQKDIQDLFLEVSGEKS